MKIKLIQHSNLFKSLKVIEDTEKIRKTKISMILILTFDISVYKIKNKVSKTKISMILSSEPKCKLL